MLFFVGILKIKQSSSSFICDTCDINSQSWTSSFCINEGTQEEAAEAYDLAAIEYRGPNAVTNFDISRYADILNKIRERDQLQQQQAANPESSIEVQSGEQSDHDQEHGGDKQLQYEAAEELNNQQHLSKLEFPVVEEVLQPQVPELVFTPPLPVEASSAMLMMDPAAEHDSAWNICLDPGFEHFFNPSDNLFSFFNSPFDDDIDSIFREQSVEREFIQDGFFNSMVVANEFPADPKNAQQALASPSSTASIASMSSEVGGLPSQMVANTSQNWGL